VGDLQFLQGCWWFQLSRIWRVVEWHYSVLIHVCMTSCCTKVESSSGNWFCTMWCPVSLLLDFLCFVSSWCTYILWTWFVYLTPTNTKTLASVFCKIFNCSRGAPEEEGGLPGATSPNQNLKNIDFVDKLISNILCNLPFIQYQPLISADE